MTLLEVRDRLTRLLDRIPCVPYAAVRYRLGEVGRQRVDSVTLDYALAELANEQNPQEDIEPGPWEPLPGIYATSRETSRKALALADEATTDLALVEPLVAVPVFEMLLAALSDLLPHALPGDRTSLPPTSRQDEAKRDALFSGVPVSGSTRATVWVSHALDHLLPDDPRLWFAIQQGAERDERLFVVARAISPATFPLFRALGVQGVQYYSVLGERAPSDELAQAIARLGWIHARSVDTLRETSFAAQFKAAAKRIADAPAVQPHMQQALRDAAIAKLHVERNTIAWLRWAEAAVTTLTISDRWFNTMSTWETLRMRTRTHAPFPALDALAMLPPLTDEKTQPRRPKRAADRKHSNAEADTLFNRGTTVTRLGHRL